MEPMKINPAGLILETLKQSAGYVSGEEIAFKLKITRQGLWKHIAKLTRQGYKVSAVPHLGYKLVSVPDKLYPYEIQYRLNNKFIGKNIYYYEETVSTQNTAWELALDNSADGTLVVSESQAKGRGRLGRKWISAKGGIYFSLILRPKFIRLQDIPQITLLAAVSCIYGLKKTVDLEYSLKWPNDILLGDKKLGGILCEMDAEQDKVNFIVLGIGINANTRDLPAAAISLFQYTAKKFSRAQILRNILEQFETLYIRAEQESFSFVLKQWESLCRLWGERVRVNVLDREVEGVAVGIDKKGYLLLRKDNREIETIYSGDVFKCNVNPPKKQS